MDSKLVAVVPDDQRSVLRRMEDLLSEIEEGLTKGYSHAAMHGALPSLGIHISLAYYHRVLRKLRQERRDGKAQGRGSTLERPMRAQSQETAANPVADAAKTEELQSPIAGSDSSSAGNIKQQTNDVKPFRWKGRDFLTRDWSNF